MSTDNTDRPAERVNLVREGNTVYRALIKVAGESREYADGNGIDRALAELINVRASQLNGCVACLNQHLPAAREAGGARITLLGTLIGMVAMMVSLDMLH